LASRTSSGSSPAASASSFIALSRAHSPGPSTGARIGVGTFRLTRSTTWHSRKAGTAYSDLLASVAGSTCVSASAVLFTTTCSSPASTPSAVAPSRIACSIHGW
jgi:hypothetical protein